MECTFQVGDRVVCVDALARCGGTLDGLQEGTVYTVADIEQQVSAGGFARAGEAYIGIHLREIPKDRRLNKAYHYARFRPVKPLSFWIGEKQEITREIERAA